MNKKNKKPAKAASRRMRGKVSNNNEAKIAAKGHGAEASKPRHQKIKPNALITEAPVTVYEVVETEVYEEAIPQESVLSDDAEEEFAS